MKYPRHQKIAHPATILQIRNQLTVVQLGIESNNPEASKRAIKNIEAIIGPLESVLKLYEDAEAMI